MAKTVKSGLNTTIQGGTVKSAPKGALRIPTGTTDERDPETVAGQLRFNTTTNLLEFFNGTSFVQLKGASNAAHTITVDSYTGDGTTTVFGNGEAGGDSTVEAPMSFTPKADQNVLVFIDGVFQPDTVYTISGTQITFGSAPGGGTSIKILHGFDTA
jgi:hypothetical protein